MAAPLKSHVILVSKRRPSGLAWRESACGRYGLDVSRARVETAPFPGIACQTCLAMFGRALEALVGARGPREEK